MKQISVENFNLYLLKVGQPDLQKLQISEDDYELRCCKKNKILEAYSIKVNYNGTNNPYCERSESQKHQNYNRSMETLPESFNYFLEDDIDKKLFEIEFFLSKK